MSVGSTELKKNSGGSTELTAGVGSTEPARDGGAGGLPFVERA